MSGREPETLSAVSLAATSVRDWRGAPARPVFVHSSFRTSSTWLWERFRRSPETTAYYEIFHEMLADITPSQVMGNHHATWDSKHPAQAPYLIEFLNLMQEEKGVLGFDVDMAFKSFIPAEGFDGALTAREKTYIDRLIRNATDNHKTPVLTCTRSVGRARALARAFPGCHILLYRRLFDQWASYSHHSLIGNDYFFDQMNQVIDHSNDVFLSSIHKCFPVTSVDVRDQNLFYRFSLFHLYIYANAFDHCDIVLDATACRDPEYKATMEDRIRQSTSLTVDLSGALRNFEISLLSVGDRALFVDTVRQFTKIICGTAPSPESADFVAGLAEQLLEDWDQNEFHTRRIRAGYIERLNDLAAIETDRKLLIETQAQSLAAASARDVQAAELAAELASAQNTLENSRKEAMDLQVQSLEAASARDALVTELAATQDILENSRKEATDLQTHLANDLARSRETVEGLSDELADSRTALEILSNEKAALSLETTSLKTAAGTRAMEMDALQQSHQDIQARLNEQASQILRMGTELNAAAARNAMLDHRLQVARGTPPTLMRRLARLKRRILKP